MCDTIRLIPQSLYYFTMLKYHGRDGNTKMAGLSSRSSAPGTCLRPAIIFLLSVLVMHAPRLLRLRSLRKLGVVEVRIESLFCEELFMGPLLDDVSVIQDKDQIRIADG